MRLRNPLDSILDSAAKVKVLRVLVSPGLELTGREVAGEANLSVPTCARALQDLVGVGLLDMEKRGRAHLYRLRARYDLVRQGIVPLFQAERALYEAAVDFLRRKLETRVVSAILFGSYARREEDEDSDLDVMLLAESPDDIVSLEDQVQSVASEFHELFGVVLTPYIKSVDEFRRMVKRRTPVALEIMKQGTHLFGKPLRNVLP